MFRRSAKLLAEEDVSCSREAKPFPTYTSATSCGRVSMVCTCACAGAAQPRQLFPNNCQNSTWNWSNFPSLLSNFTFSVISTCMCSRSELTLWLAVPPINGACRCSSSRRRLRHLLQPLQISLSALVGGTAIFFTPFHSEYRQPVCGLSELLQVAAFNQKGEKKGREQGWKGICGRRIKKQQAANTLG